MTLLDCDHFYKETGKCQLLKSLKDFSILQAMKLMSDLNVSHWKMSDFVSSPLFGFNFKIKLRNSDFKGY